MFTYNSATLVQINSIHVDLYTDINPTKAPLESHLTSGVFLRNQNQVPVASFTKALSGTTAIVLNGSASYDPESQSLRYVWWDNGVEDHQRRRHRLHVSRHAGQRRISCSCRSSIRRASRASRRRRPSPSPEDDHEAPS